MQHTLIDTQPYIHTHIHTHIHADIITYVQTFENIPRLHTHTHTYIQTLAHTHLILPGCVGSLCVCEVPEQAVAYSVDVENQTKKYARRGFERECREHAEHELEHTNAP